jgi:hypothetical protein
MVFRTIDYFEMKTLFTFLFILAVSVLQAQVPIEVKVEKRPSSKGVQPSFEVMVPQATAGEAIDLWKKTIVPGKLFKKTPKMSKAQDEFIVNDVLISDITAMPLNVITQVSSFTGNIYFRAFLQTEAGFLGSDGSTEEVVSAATRYVRNYAVQLYRQAVGKELKQEEKKLKELENKQSRLQRQNKNFNNKISDARRDERDLQNEAQQNEELLNNQQNIIGVDSTDPNAKNAKDQLDKQLRDNQKDIAKTQKSQNRYSRKVYKNQKDQREKANQIERQQQKVEEVQTKLDNIR